jgi:hypothetical protein
MNRVISDKYAERHMVHTTIAGSQQGNSIIIIAYCPNTHLNKTTQYKNQRLTCELDVHSNGLATP